MSAGRPAHCALDDTDGLRRRPREGWDVSLLPSEAIIGTSLALRVLLVCSGQDSHTVAGHAIFDEARELICDGTWDSEEAGSVEWIYTTIVRLITAFDMLSQPEVLVFAFVLLERFVIANAGVLAPSTIRSIVLTAYSLAAKSACDELITDAASCLHHSGFEGMSPSKLLSLEKAFVEAISWRLVVSRSSYSLYTFELRTLVASHLGLLCAQSPLLVQHALRLDRLDALTSSGEMGGGEDATSVRAVDTAPAGASHAPPCARSIAPA